MNFKDIKIGSCEVTNIFVVIREISETKFETVLC